MPEIDKGLGLKAKEIKEEAKADNPENANSIS